jgi:hypothetical protein
VSLATISLPINKFTAWMTAIEKLILKQKVTAKELEMIIGQLTHVSVIIPLIHHFLSQIQELQKQATNNN